MGMSREQIKNLASVMGMVGHGMKPSKPAIRERDKRSKEEVEAKIAAAEAKRKMRGEKRMRDNTIAQVGSA